MESGDEVLPFGEESDQDELLDRPMPDSRLFRSHYRRGSTASSRSTSSRVPSITVSGATSPTTSPSPSRIKTGSRHRRQRWKSGTVGRPMRSRLTDYSVESSEDDDVPLESLHLLDESYQLDDVRTDSVIDGLKEGLDANGNTLPSKKRIPRPFFAFLGVVIILNVIIFSLDLARQGGARVDVPDNAAQLFEVEWLILLDSIVVAWCFMWILIRLFMIALEKASHRFPLFQAVYYFCYPYEAPVRFISWAIFLLVLYPFIVDASPIDAQDSTEKTSELMLWALLEIGLLFGFKVITMNFIEGLFFRDINDRIDTTAVHEGWLVALERSSWFGKECALLASHFSNKKISDFLSDSLSSLDHMVSIQGLACVDLCSLKLARQLIDQRGKGKPYLDRVDMAECLRAEELEEAFAKFDINKDGHVDERDLARSMKFIHQERRRALNHIRSKIALVEATSSVANGVLWVAAFLAVLLAFQVAVVNVIIPLGILTLSLIVTFANVLHELVNGLYMLYFMQPFRIGDHISVGDAPEILVVEELGVICTHFTTLAGYGVILRNMDVSKKQVKNYSVGNRVATKIYFGVSLGTTTEQMGQMLILLTEYMEKSSIWAEKFVLTTEGIAADRPCVVVCLETFVDRGGLWQDQYRWKTAKTSLLLEVQKVASKVGIELGPIGKRNLGPWY